MSIASLLTVLFLCRCSATLVGYCPHELAANNKFFGFRKESADGKETCITIQMDINNKMKTLDYYESRCYRGFGGHLAEFRLGERFPSNTKWNTPKREMSLVMGGTLDELVGENISVVMNGEDGTSNCNGFVSRCNVYLGNFFHVNRTIRKKYYSCRNEEDCQTNTGVFADCPMGTKCEGVITSMVKQNKTACRLAAVGEKKPYGSRKIVKCGETIVQVYFACEHRLLYNCTYTTVNWCHYDENRKKCVKQSYIKVTNEDHPYLKCTLPEPEECPCSNCVTDAWQNWVSPSGTCGTVTQARYGVRRNHTGTCTLEKHSECCEETRVTTLVPCSEYYYGSNLLISLYPCRRGIIIPHPSGGSICSCDEGFTGRFCEAPLDTVDDTKLKFIIIYAFTIICVLILFIAIIGLLYKKRKKRHHKHKNENEEHN